MIPALILWLMRKYGKSILRMLHPAFPLLVTVQYPARLIVMLILTLLLYFKADAQQVLKYSVLVRNESIGYVHAVQHITGRLNKVEVRSSLDFRMVFRYQMDIQEEITLVDNMLLCSRLIRKKNGEETINRLKQRNGNRLEVRDNGRISYAEIPRMPVHVLQLYFKEPEGSGQVYSEKFQQELPLKTAGSHTYILYLPDGNVNTYYYSNGICTKVLISSTFYNAVLIKE